MHHKFVTYLDTYPLTYSPGTHMGRHHGVYKVLSLMMPKNKVQHEKGQSESTNSSNQPASMDDRSWQRECT